MTVERLIDILQHYDRRLFVHGSVAYCTEFEGCEEARIRITDSELDGGGTLIAEIGIDSGDITDSGGAA